LSQSPTPLGHGSLHDESQHDEPVTQSSFPAQALPGSHLAGQLPPQSMSVSVPFFVPSLQGEGWHVPPSQTPLTQSAPVVHPLSSSHGVQSAPPQSMSVSTPFLIPSIQLGRHVVPEH
jgi:hypothetical protein